MRIEELEATIAWAREHAADSIEGYDYDPDNDMTVKLALLLIERDERIEGLEARAAGVRGTAVREWVAHAAALESEVKHLLSKLTTAEQTLEALGVTLI